VDIVNECLAVLEAVAQMPGANAPGLHRLIELLEGKL
jgi:hypothetical protein